MIPASLASFEEAMSAISKATHNAKLAFAGTAAEAAAVKYVGESVVSSIRQPDALWVARVALTREASSEAPKPLYLRPPDAKLPMPKT